MIKATRSKTSPNRNAALGPISNWQQAKIEDRRQSRGDGRPVQVKTSGSREGEGHIRDGWLVDERMGKMEGRTNRVRSEDGFGFVGSGDESALQLLTLSGFLVLS